MIKGAYEYFEPICMREVLMTGYYADIVINKERIKIYVKKGIDQVIFEVEP